MTCHLQSRKSWLLLLRSLSIVSTAESVFSCLSFDSICSCVGRSNAPPLATPGHCSHPPGVCIWAHCGPPDRAPQAPRGAGAPCLPLDGFCQLCTGRNVSRSVRSVSLSAGSHTESCCSALCQSGLFLAVPYHTGSSKPGAYCYGMHTSFYFSQDWATRSHDIQNPCTGVG